MSLATIQALELIVSGSDNEKKVSCLSTLRDQLESLEGVPDLQPLINPLKLGLESSNGHLNFATLNCLAPLARKLGSITHQAALKQLVISLYSPTSGSVLSFLGDAKQRTREIARTALLAAAEAACEAHSKAQTSTRNDDVLQELERIVKEHGLANKTARARVQTLHYLSEIRSRYPALIPIKPYLPSLVSLLEDSDVSVRAAASECITTVFSDPSLPPSARGDLKNELSKQGTRRSTVDTVLAKVFSPPIPSTVSTSLVPTTDEPPPTPKDDAPPDAPLDSHLVDSLARSQSGPPGSDSSPASGIIHPVFVSGPRELESIFAKMLPPWEGKETEHNWQAREANLNTLRGMIKTNVHTQYTPDFIIGLKSISEGLLKSLSSLRTTMAVGVCNAFVELSSLGQALDPLIDIILPPLLRMASQTKKIVFQASQAAVSALIKSVPSHPRLLQYISVCVEEKTVQARVAGIARLKEFLECHGQRSKSQIDSGGGLGLIEKALKRSLADASPMVRETAREAFWICSAIWPQMTGALFETLDGPTRKQLEKASTGRQVVSSNLFKAEKEQPTRVSVRSLIKSSRSTHRTVKNSDLVQAASISPQRSASASHGESPLGTKTIATTLGLTYHGFERPSLGSGVVQSPPRNEFKRSLSTRDSPSAGRTKNLLSSSSPPHRSINSKTSSPRQPAQSPSLSRIFKPSIKAGEQQSGDGNLARQTRKTLSTDNIVEDAMKAQAAQAESAAHRLLELTEDENEPQPLVPLGPGGVLLSTTDCAQLVHSPFAQLEAFATLQAIDKDLMSKQFEDSPRYFHRTESEEVQKKGFGRRANKNLWWHRQAELSMCAARQDLSPNEVHSLIEQFEQRPLDTRQDRQTYLDLSQACFERKSSNGKIDEDGSVSFPEVGPEENLGMKKHMEFWMEGNLFEHLFEGLKDNLKRDAPPDVRDAQLILLRGLILFETSLMAGKETELCEVLLVIASEGASNVLIAVEALGSLWAETSDPLYGLSCLRSCVEMISRRNLIDQIGSSPSSVQRGSENWMGLTMNCLGGFFCRLPAEIVEEELPKASELVKRALNHRKADIRMSAVMSLVSANRVIKNDREIFQVLGNLSTAQEALITYYLTPSH